MTIFSSGAGQIAYENSLALAVGANAGATKTRKLLKTLAKFFDQAGRKLNKIHDELGELLHKLAIIKAQIDKVADRLKAIEAQLGRR